jgi:hypothetical protein
MAELAILVLADVLFEPFLGHRLVVIEVIVMARREAVLSRVKGFRLFVMDSKAQLRGSPVVVLRHRVYRSAVVTEVRFYAV